MTIKLICAFVLAFLFASAFGKFYVPWLRRQKAGQQIKSEVEWHKAKAGTPTMGGVIFILAVILVCLTVGFDGMLHGRFEHIFVLLFACVFGLIGFLDDWEKLKKKENMGLSSRSKFLLQLAAALVFILLMRQIGFVRPHLYVPFVHKTVYMPEWLYMVFAVFVIVGTVNAVNITDGIDGLASGTSLPVFLFFVAVTLAWGRRYQELGIFASGMVGGLCGFIIYNFNPAKCFMGDTGSLFLGGAIAALAFRGDPVGHHPGDVFQDHQAPHRRGQAHLQDGPLPPSSGEGRLDGKKVEGKRNLFPLYRNIPDHGDHILYWGVSAFPPVM